MLELPSPYTVEADRLGSYGDEQDQMKNWFGKLHCRVSLSLTWWSDTKISICCLASHFIDENWLLERKIIGLRSVEYDNNAQVGLSLPELTKSMLSKWSIDKNLFSMTTTNDFGNGELIIEIKRWVNDQKVLIVNEDMFHVCCFAHIVNLMAQDMLHEIHNVVVKIRLCITYINEMKDKFPGTEMPCLDVRTLWGSTYLMLRSALQLREAFCHMNENGNDLKLNPSVEEWDKVEVICKYLQVFYVLLQSFGGSELTANIYFPKVSETYVNLLNWEKSSCVYIRGIATRMKAKFEKYWRKCSLVLAVAVVLDPRYKFLLVEFLYNKIYGKDAITKIGELRNALGCIYDEYAIQPRGSSDSVVSDNIFSYNAMEAFCKCKDKVFDISPKSELDVYLEEPILDPEDMKFDILVWWCLNSSKYPTLGRMARDILAIPMSLFGSDSLFSTPAKIIGPTIAPKDNEIIRSGVNPSSIEASKQCGAEKQPISRKFTDEEEWVWKWVQTVPKDKAVARIGQRTIMDGEIASILTSSDSWICTMLMSYACSWLNLSMFKAEEKRWAFLPYIADFVVRELGIPTHTTARNEQPRHGSLQGTNVEFLLETCNGYDLAKCDMVFAPVLLFDHWFLICINISKKRLEVLNSMSGYYDQQNNQTTQHYARFMTRMVQVLNGLINAFSPLSRGKTLLAIDEWEVHNLDVPQQSNSNDCGVFVMNFMKLYRGDACGLMDAFVAAQYEMRKQLLVDMLLSPVNRIRPSFRTTEMES